MLVDQWNELTVHLGLPASRQLADSRRRFEELVDVWKRDSALQSSLTKMVLHPAYQQIIGMGRVAIPLLLHELEERPDHWGWALEAISGISPARPEDAGRVDLVAKAWLRWGTEQGYR